MSLSRGLGKHFYLATAERNTNNFLRKIARNLI
jgi:hypothetical protein